MFVPVRLWPLPVGLLARGFTEALDPDEFEAAMAGEVKGWIRYARKLAAQDAPWRSAVGIALKGRDEALREAVLACRGFLVGGGVPFICRRYRLCPACLAYKLKVLRDHDLEIFRRRRTHEVVVGTPTLLKPSFPSWRRGVLAYRALALPASFKSDWTLSRWIFVVGAPGDFADAVRLRGPRTVKVEDLAPIYDEPLQALRALSVAEAVRIGRVPNRRLFSAGGFLREKVKLPKKRKPLLLRTH